MQGVIILLSTFIFSFTLFSAVPTIQMELETANSKTDAPIGHLPQKSTVKNDDLPVFPAKDEENIRRRLKPALDAYQQGEYEKAIQEIQKLLETNQRGAVEEVASFLKGDIYQKLGQDGDPDFLQAALSAYGSGNSAYPDSENSARGLWKMGIISSRLGLNYESIANFKRILSKFPKSDYAPKAQLGIAQTYQQWGKWEEALAAYAKVDATSLSDEDRPLAVLGVAETLYNSGDFPHAYMIYTNGWKNFPSYFSQAALTLFHFGNAAFQTNHRKEAKEIFFRFFNTFPRDTLTLSVISSLVNIFYLEKDGKEAIRMGELLQDLYPGPVGTKTIDLIEKIEEIKTQNCLKNSRPQSLLEPMIQKCPEEDSRQIDQADHKIREMSELIESILKEPPPSLMIQRFVFQEGEQFFRLNQPLMAFEIERKLFPFVETPLFQKEVLVLRNKAAIKAIDKEYQAGGDLKIVEIYFDAPEIFNGKIIFGPSGFKIASCLIRQGFYSQALPILETSLNSLSLTQTEEAFFLYATTLAEIGEIENAKKKMGYFLRKYPNSPRRNELIESLGNLFYQTKNYDLAIEKYKLWLSLYSSSPNFKKVSLKLASAYDRNGQYQEAILVYKNILKKEPHPDFSIHLKLGEDLFQIKKYHEAISSFEIALQEKGDKKTTDWIRFQIARSYARLNQKIKEQEFLAELAKSSEDPIIKTLAAEKISSK